MANAFNDLPAHRRGLCEDWLGDRTPNFPPAEWVIRLSFGTYMYAVAPEGFIASRYMHAYIGAYAYRTPKNQSIYHLLSFTSRILAAE